jgi:hypothetical protein
VLLGTAVNCQGHRNVTELSMAVVMEGVYCLFYFNIFDFSMIWYILLTAICLTSGGSSTVQIYTQTVNRITY